MGDHEAGIDTPLLDHIQEWLQVALHVRRTPRRRRDTPPTRRRRGGSQAACGKLALRSRGTCRQAQTLLGWRLTCRTSHRSVTLDTETLILAASQIASGMVTTVNRSSFASGHAENELREIAKTAVALAMAIEDEAEAALS